LCTDRILYGLSFEYFCCLITCRFGTCLQLNVDFFLFLLSNTDPFVGSLANIVVLTDGTVDTWYFVKYFQVHFLYEAFFA